MFHVYFLKNLKNSKTYVGFTSKSPLQRLKEHNSGTNQFTKNNKPFRLIYYETYFCKQDAQNREKFYKMGFGKLIKQQIINVLNQKEIKPKFKDD